MCGDRFPLPLTQQVGREALWSRVDLRGVLPAEQNQVVVLRLSASLIVGIHRGPCGCRQWCPDRSSGVVILVEDTAESILQPDVKVIELAWVGDRWR
jgi:hypothetical protein